jgi:hypothetical protein
VEFAFFWYSLEVNCTESFEYGLYILNVVLERPFCVDENVVDVGDNGDVEKVSECVINELLTGCRCVCQSYGHHEELVKPILGSESGFPFFSFSHSDAVEGVA